MAQSLRLPLINFLFVMTLQRHSAMYYMMPCHLVRLQPFK